MAGTAAASASLIVAFHIDQHLLLVPQNEVFSLESVLEVKREAAKFPCAGRIDLAGVDWPAYCLDGSLAPTLDFASQRRLCLLLNDEQYRLALVCDQVETLNRPPRARHQLPLCQAKSNALVEQLVIYEETVRCLTTTARLSVYCQHKTHLGGVHG
jgi:hypothetical protein